jgi:hypothetical protein
MFRDVERNRAAFKAASRAPEKKKVRQTEVAGRFS